MITDEEIKRAFTQAFLQETYNFLEEDLLKLGHAIAAAAAPKIAKTERDLCVEFVRSLNGQVADALEAKRGPL